MLVMKLYLTKSFEKDYKKLSVQIQKQLDKQLILLLENIKYPSLRIKKIEGYQKIWEGRINQGCRFTFQIEDDTYIIRRAGPHSILKNP